MEDNYIVDLYLARDESAISRSEEKYGKQLRQIANRVCNDHQTAEECENDTYLKAWNMIPPHEPKGYLFSFLAKITRAIAIDRLKEMTRLKRSAELVELTTEIESAIPSGIDVAEDYNAKELSRIINGYLKTISAEKRNVFIRRYWFMESIAEISKKYSISESKIKSMLFRTRAELKVWIEKEGYTV